MLKPASRSRLPVASVVLLWSLFALTPARADAPAPLAEPLRLFEQLQEVIVRVSSRVKPWVVHIEAVQKRGDQKYKVQGSGLILDARGRIITNHHIVDEAKLITVTLSDNSKLEARLLGSDRQTD